MDVRSSYGEDDWYEGPWMTVQRSEDSSIFNDAEVDDRHIVDRHKEVQ